MKHFSKPSLYLVALVAIGCLFYACSDEELSDVSSPVQEADFTVRVKNGYLEFKDQAAFDEIKASLKDKDREALDTWESQFEGFTSLRRVDEMSIDAQDEYFERLSVLDEAALTSIRQQKGDDFPYSDFLLSRKDIFTLESEGIYHLNFPALIFDKLKLLNEDGLVQVGDSLYKYDATSIKIIQDGNYEKLRGLSGTAQKDIDHGILVFEIEEEEIQLYDSHNSRFDISGNDDEARCSNQSGKDKVIGKARLGYTKGYPGFVPGIGYYPYVIVTAENFGKGIFGWNRKRTTALAIEGTVTVRPYSPFPYTTVDVDVSTGGVLTPYLQAPIWPNPKTDRYWYDAKYGFGAEGEVTVHGRGGTSCTI